MISFIRSEEESEKPAVAGTSALNEDLYINPVCGVHVQKSTAKHVVEMENLVTSAAMAVG